MSRLLPSRSDSAPDDREPRVVDVDDDEADELIAALGSGTARDLLATLHEEPATTSELSEELDTSLQNVQYHLRKLSDADIIDVVDTAYSEKGREMNVYAPADEPLVLFAGGSRSESGIRTALRRLLGGYAIIGMAAIVVQRLLSISVTDDAAAPGATTEDAEPTGEDVADDTDTTAADAPEETPLPDEEAVDATGDDVHPITDGVDATAEHAVSLLEPGPVFFLGGAVVFTVAWLYWYRSRRTRVR